MNDSNLTGSQVDLDLKGTHLDEFKSPLTSIFYSEEPENQFHDESPQSIRSRMFVDTSYKESDIRINKERNSSLKTVDSEIKSSQFQDLSSCEEMSSCLSSKKGYLSLSLNDPSNVSEAIESLSRSSNIYDQVDLLHYLSSCRPMSFHVTTRSTLEQCLEEVYIRAMYIR